MRIRTIKPEFWTHPVIVRLSDATKLLAIGLLNYSDDEGYFYADAPLVRAALRPLDEDSTIVRGCLEQLSRIGYIELREHSSHGLVGRVVNFRAHQRVDRPSKSKIAPMFAEAEPQATKPQQSMLFDEGSSSTRRKLAEHSSPEQGTGNREQGTGISSAPASAAAGKGAVKEAPSEPKKPRERNPLFDALATATDGHPDQLTPATNRAVGVALAQIAKVCPDLTPAEITRRAANYRAHFRDAALTATALAKHWARCDAAPADATLDLIPQRGPTGPNGELYQKW